MLHTEPELRYGAGGMVINDVLEACLVPLRQSAGSPYSKLRAFIHYKRKLPIRFDSIIKVFIP